MTVDARAAGGFTRSRREVCPGANRVVTSQTSDRDDGRERDSVAGTARRCRSGPA